MFYRCGLFPVPLSFSGQVGLVVLFAHVVGSAHVSLRDQMCFGTCGHWGGRVLEEEGAKGDLIARLFMLWHKGHSILDTCEDFKNHLHHYLFTSDRITVST